MRLKMTLKLNRVQGVGKTERTETSWIRLSVSKAGERHPQAGKDGAGIAEGTGAPSSQRSGGRMEGTPTRDGHAHGVSATHHVLGVGGSAALVPVRPSHGRVAPARLQRLWVEPARAREPRVADGRSPRSPRADERRQRRVRAPSRLAQAGGSESPLRCGGSCLAAEGTVSVQPRAAPAGPGTRGHCMWKREALLLETVPVALTVVP